MAPAEQLGGRVDRVVGIGHRNGYILPIGRRTGDAAHPTGATGQIARCIAAVVAGPAQGDPVSRGAAIVVIGALHPVFGAYLGMGEAGRNQVKALAVRAWTRDGQEDAVSAAQEALDLQELEDQGVPGDENPDEGIIYNIDKIINLLMDEGISRKCAVEILDNDLRKVDPLNVFLWPN